LSLIENIVPVPIGSPVFLLTLLENIIAAIIPLDDLGGYTNVESRDSTGDSFRLEHPELIKIKAAYIKNTSLFKKYFSDLNL